jgi:outer membrane protein assembly factor BamB
LLRLKARNDGNKLRIKNIGMKNKLWICTAIIATIALSCSRPVNTEDWSRWRGTNIDGIAKAKNINLDWSEETPTLSWIFRQGGAGYSSPTIVGSTLYCQGSADSSDFVYALNTETGELIWKQVLGQEFVDEFGNGPRGMITVDGKFLYLIRAAGQIHCLSAIDGKEIWQKHFKDDFGGKTSSPHDWGFSESPLVDGNLVICTPGGEQGTMVALDKRTGDVVWRTIEWTDLSGYSSPIVAEVDGVKQYIQQSIKGVAGVRASDGKLLWKVENEHYRIAVIPTPIYHNNTVYVTAGYNAGCTFIRLTKNGDIFDAEVVYQNRNLVGGPGGVVLVAEHIFGSSELSGWTCQNMETGEQAWSTGRTGSVTDVRGGAILVVNDHLFIYDANGLLAIIEASTEGWNEVGRMKIPERTEIQTSSNTIHSHPVVANGKLYLRDQDLLFAFDLSK